MTKCFSFEIESDSMLIQAKCYALHESSLSHVYAFLFDREKKRRVNCENDWDRHLLSYRRTGSLKTFVVICPCENFWGFFVKDYIEEVIVNERLVFAVCLGSMFT